MVVLRASEWALKRFVKFILKRALNKIIGNNDGSARQSLASIDIALSEGILELQDVELNTKFVRDALLSSFIDNGDENKTNDSLSIASATCGKIKIKIPWNNLYADRCELLVEDVSLRIVRRSARKGESAVVGGEMAMKRQEVIRKEKTFLHIYDNTDSNSHSENVLEIERAQKENKDEDENERDNAAQDEKTTEPGAVMKAMKRLVRGALFSVRNVSFDFCALRDNVVDEKSIVSLLIESGTYVHEGSEESTFANSDDDNDGGTTTRPATIPSTPGHSKNKEHLAVVNMRGIELKVGEHVVLSPFHATLSRMEDASEGHSTYAFSIENSIHASLKESVVNAFSKLRGKENEGKNATRDSESIPNAVMEDEKELGDKEKSLLISAMNKSLLDCVIGDSDDDDDDEFYDCESSEHSNEIDMEKFTRSVISSFYEENDVHDKSEGDSIPVPSSTYCIAFVWDSKLSVEWNDGSTLSLTLDRSSRFEYCGSSQMKLFAPRVVTALQVDQSSPLLQLEIVSDEVLPLASIDTKKISFGKEHAAVTLSSAVAALSLDGESFIQIPELAHQVVTLANRSIQNQRSAREDAFASTADETVDISSSTEQILQLGRVSSIQYSMTSTRLRAFFTKIRMGQIDALLQALCSLPDGHPLKLKQSKIGDLVDSFAIDVNIDSLDVNVDGKLDTSSFSPDSGDVFASAREKLPKRSEQFQISFTEVALVAALAVCGDQDANFMSFTSNRIWSRGGCADAEICSIDKCAVQFSKLPVSEDCAYSQTAFRIFVDRFNVCLGRSAHPNDDCSRDMRALLEAFVYTFGGNTDDAGKGGELRNTSLVVAVSAHVDFNEVQAIARDDTSTVVVETKRVSIRVAPKEDKFKVYESFLENQRAFATHSISARVRDSFSMSVNDVVFLSFLENDDVHLFPVFALDAEYSPGGKSTVISSFDRPCELLMNEANTIATIRSVLDSITESRERPDFSSKTKIDREERDEKDLEYVFIKQPRKRRDTYKEEEKSKIALEATTKALEDASKADLRMNPHLANAAERQQDAQESTTSSRHSATGKKAKVLSLHRSSRVNAFSGDGDDILSSRKTVRFLPLPLNAPESSTLTVHAFAKSLDVILRTGTKNACKGLRMEIKDISNRFDIFDVSSRWGYHLVCDVDSINVVDLTPNVAWPNIYSRRIEGEPAASSDFHIMVTGVRCDANDIEENTLGSCEIALKFSLCPARVRLEQSVVKTLLDFMSNTCAEGAQNSDIVESDDDDFCDDFDNESNDGDINGNSLYFQLVEIAPWSLRLDYCSNENVDVYALTAGNYLEALNLIPWGGVSLEFPYSRLVGISGARNMLDAVSSRYIDCVTKDQAHKFVKAFAPVQSANRMTSAAKDIYKKPLAYRQRKGDAALSSRMFGEAMISTARFCKAVSLEALKLGEYVSGNASAVLEAAENLLDGEEVRREKRTDRDRMPDGITDGVLSAKDDFVGGVVKAKNAVLRDPLRKFQTPKDYGGGAKAAAKTLIRNAPRAGVAALSGTTKATNKVIVGLKNTVFDDCNSTAEER